KFSKGKLSKTFNGKTTKGKAKNYTLAIPYGTSSVKITPTAMNKNFMVKTAVTTKSGSTKEYKRSQYIPISQGKIISVESGRPAWPSMNNGEWGSGAEAVPASVYKIKISYTIPAPKIKKAKVNSKGTTITWKKAKYSQGYRIYRASKKNGNFKYLGVAKKNASNFLDVRLSGNEKKSYYKVVSIREIAGKKVLSKASEAIKATN
ncbi:MAG: hypothetical protein ACRCUS_07745, partial [Anaerovoracaceae bacterium]